MNTKRRAYDKAMWLANRMAAGRSTPKLRREWVKAMRELLGR